MPMKRVLLVEGPDDEHVLKHLSAIRQGPCFDEIIPHGGYVRLLPAIPVTLKAVGDEAVVGIVLDADTDISNRWHAVRNPLLDLGYDVPKNPEAKGTIIEPPVGAFLPRAGIWIMPNNQTPGILEDFLSFLVPNNSVLYKHAVDSVEGIPPSEQRFNKTAKPKVMIHTWLAWQEKPGKPLGTAIKARFLDPDVDQVTCLISWLDRLFNQ